MCAQDLRKERLKVAVVGLGKMGLLHASIISTLPDAELVAICDKSTLMLRISRKIFQGVHISDNMGKFFGLDLDAIYVTTPIFLHSSVVKTVYLNKLARNVFVEKTLASNYDEAKELCKLAQSSGGINMVGYMKRFSVTFRKAKELLDENKLGKVHSFEAYAYSSDFTGDNKTSAPRGGVLRDLGCHAVDLALWFFNDLKIGIVKSQSRNSVHFEVENSGGLQGIFKVSQCMENYRLPEIGLSIRGSKGTMIVNDDKLNLKLDEGKSFTWYRQDLKDNVYFWLGDAEYFREDEYFFKRIRDGLNAEPNFYTASRVDYLIEKVNGRAVQDE